MAYLQVDFESAVQEYLQDTGTTNNNRMVEDLTIQLVGGNGARTVYTLSKNNIVGGTTGVLFNLNQTGFTNTGVASVDSVNGLMTFASAPQLSSSVPSNLTVLYYFQNFNLSEIDSFINFGLGAINTNPMTGDNSNLAYQGLGSPQFNVVCLYATYMGYYSLANRYARMVNTTAEGKSSGKDAISKQYLALAKEYYDMAEKERLAINGPRQGTSTVASAKFSNKSGAFNAISFGYGGRR